MTKYRRPFSVDYRKPVVMDSSDPRYKNLERYRSRLGRKVIVKDLPEPMQIISPVEKFMNIYANVNTKAVSTIVDNEGNSYSLMIDNNEPDYSPVYFINKINKNGSLIWELNIDDGTNNNFSDRLRVGTITIDSNNDLYLLGIYDSGSIQTPNDLAFLMKINSSGSLIWKKTIKNDNYQLNFWQGAFGDGIGKIKTAYCDIDSDFNIYIAINVESHNPSNIYYSSAYEISASFVAKIDSTGDIVWSNIHQPVDDGGAQFQYEVSDIAIDSSNNLYVLRNYFRQGAPFSGGVRYYTVTKYSTSGSIVYNKNITNIPVTGSGGITRVLDISIDDNDNLYILLFRSEGPYDVAYGVYLLKFSSSFVKIWEKNIGTSFHSPALSNIKNNYMFVTTRPGAYAYDPLETMLLKIDLSGQIQNQQKISYPITDPAESSGIQIVDLKQNNKALILVGRVSVNYGCAIISGLPNSTSKNYSIRFSNALIYDDNDPINGESYSNSFNINITNSSENSSTETSIFGTENFSDYISIDSPFTITTDNLTLEIKTPPVLTETKGVFI